MRSRFLVGAAVVLALTLGIAAAVQAAGGSSKNFQNAALGSRVTNESTVDSEVCTAGWKTFWGPVNINKPSTAATIVTVSAESEATNGLTAPKIRVKLDGVDMPPLNNNSQDGIFWPISATGLPQASSYTFAENNAAGGHTLNFQVKAVSGGSRACIRDFSATIVY